MKIEPKISIIIPLYDIQERFFKDFLKYDLLDYSRYEVLVVSDKKVNLPQLRNCSVKLFLTGKRKTGPAEKRDLAIKKSSGEICAFIDDDAYPDKNWLKNAVKWFFNKNIVGVGGPGVTPIEDNFWQKVSGGIVESFLCSGGVQYRYFPTKKAFVEDYPGYNLLVRKNTLKKVKGYNCNFYGGEDTFLCIKLIKHGDIVYDPRVVVYHHRRKFPVNHLKQIANVGLHRGYFFIKYPETSRMLFYLLPTFMTIGLVGFIILAIILPKFFIPVFIILIVFFWLLGSYSVFRHRFSLKMSLISGFGIIITHAIYGIMFIKGLITKKLYI